jgi:hypothetical protein
MNEEDFALIRSRMLSLREGTGDMTREEVVEWLRTEMQDELNKVLHEGAPGLQNYGLLNDPERERKRTVFHRLHADPSVV